MTDTSTSAPLLTREQIKAQWEAASQHVFDLCAGRTKWTMSIPPEPRDSDNLLIDALKGMHDHGIAALDRIEAQETEIGRLRTGHDALRVALEEVVNEYDSMRQYEMKGKGGYASADECFNDAANTARAALAAVADTQKEAGDA